MLDLTFGEQVKIILRRKGMTIKELAEIIEERTGKKMSRQNLTQRLGRDNFQEQDMRIIAGLLGYQVSVQLTPLTEAPQEILSLPPTAPAIKQKPVPVPDQKVTTLDGSTLQIPNLFRKAPVLGDINPLTGDEYLTNTVRQHPTMEKYLQVYDQSTHEWIDVNEDYFWEFQASKKQILGADYQEPILI